MKYLVLFLFTFCITSLFSQSQLGITIGANYTKISSDVLNINPNIGYEFGITSIGGLHKSADLLIEMLFTNQQISMSGVSSDSSIVEEKFSISNFNVNTLYNQYLIIPDGFKPHAALQAGISFSLINTWKPKEENTRDDLTYGTFNYTDKDFQDLDKINTYFLLGLCAGFEQLRATVRYNYALSNILRPLNENIRQTYLSLTITYFFQKFK